MLITIGGVSRAGKSTLAYLLRHLLGYHRCIVVSQDNYPQVETLIPKIKSLTDWELPESIDWNRYEQAVLRYLNHEKIVIAEGIFIHHSSDLPEPQLHIQIEIEKEIFVKRREKENRWGSEALWYIDHVWTSHFRHGQTDRAAIRLNGVKSFPVGVITQTILGL